MRIFLASLLVLAFALAGCGDDPSASPTTSGPNTPKVVVDESDPNGAITGVVVDNAIVPIKGATIALGGTKRNTTSDEHGAFVFDDVPPGTYFLDVTASGYKPIQTSTDVAAGAASSVRIQLAADLAPQAYHTTLAYRGFIQTSAAATGALLNIILDEFGQNPTCTCSFNFDTTGLDVKTIVVEAVWEDSLPSPTGPCDMYLEVYPADLDDGTDDIQGGFLTSPILEPYPIEAWGKDENNTAWNIRLTGSEICIQVNQPYDLFVTLFVTQPAPDGWSLVGGSV